MQVWAVDPCACAGLFGPQALRDRMTAPGSSSQAEWVELQVYTPSSRTTQAIGATLWSLGDPRHVTVTSKGIYYLEFPKNANLQSARYGR